MNFLLNAEVVASRSMNYLYIYLDIASLVILLVLLILKKKYQAIIAGLLAGLLYWAVDYGLFYAAFHARTVTGADTLWFLLWLSMSYGFTNFVWIWLWLDHDDKLWEWSLYIPLMWFVEAIISQNLGANTGVITISRTTRSYHWIMAIFLVVGYLYLIIHNLFRQREEKGLSDFYGSWPSAFLVQFAWEAVFGNHRNPQPGLAKPSSSIRYSKPTWAYLISS
jgi:hypothetical protein